MPPDKQFLERENPPQTMPFLCSPGSAWATTGLLSSAIPSAPADGRQMAAIGRRLGRKQTLSAHLPPRVATTMQFRPGNANPAGMMPITLRLILSTVMAVPRCRVRIRRKTGCAMFLAQHGDTSESRVALPGGGARSAHRRTCIPQNWKETRCDRLSRCKRTASPAPVRVT